MWQLVLSHDQDFVNLESKPNHSLCLHKHSTFTLLHVLPSSGATLSMRSLVKEEPDWRTGIMTGDRTGLVGGPLRLRRGSRFTWRKECQSIMERWTSLSATDTTFKPKIDLHIGFLNAGKPAKRDDGLLIASGQICLSSLFLVCQVWHGRKCYFGSVFGSFLSISLPFK